MLLLIGEAEEIRNIGQAAGVVEAGFEESFIGVDGFCGGGGVEGVDVGGDADDGTCGVAYEFVVVSWSICEDRGLLTCY
jgi:hypothetical protein